jgi:hypothetical protein
MAIDLVALRFALNGHGMKSLSADIEQVVWQTMSSGSLPSAERAGEGGDLHQRFKSPLPNPPRPRGGNRTKLIWQLDCNIQWLMCLAVSLIFFTGCYDGGEMVKRAQSAALNTRLAEVDLGKFQTTLPRDPNTNHFTAVDLHIFGTIPRYQLAAVTRQLKSDEYRLRYETLAALRQSTREELADPNFTQLRARIEKVVNGVLADAPIKEVGFYQLTMRSP